jgi:hypothetical protein
MINQTRRTLLATAAVLTFTAALSDARAAVVTYDLVGPGQFLVSVASSPGPSNTFQYATNGVDAGAVPSSPTAFTPAFATIPIDVSSLVLDFAALANHPGTPSGDQGPLVSVRNTLGDADPLNDLIATFSATKNGNPAFPYLDSGSGLTGGGAIAGLGVCGTLTTPGQQCTPSDDDNITGGEVLSIAFTNGAGAPVTMVFDPTFFRNLDHGTSFPANALLDVAINGGSFTAYPLSNTQPNGLTGSAFQFRYNNSQIYLSSVNSTAVPEPATLAILGTGLLGLGAMLRRRRRDV